MKLTLESIGDAIRSYYDRLIALAAILALLASLAMLMNRLHGIRTETRQFQAWENGLRPEFADATNVTLDTFNAGHDDLAKPFQIPVSDWTRKMSIPELRVACIDCARPIPYEATECPRCGAKQVKGPKPSEDKDDDGMLDEWENGHGLNPLDPDDAKADLDKDGFSNREEFLFKTDPTDPASAPPVIAKLRVADIKAMPFHLKFMALNHLTAGDIFQINSTKSGKTSWYRMREIVDGYTITNYRSVIVRERMDAGTMMRDVDRSVLTLQSLTSGRTIFLQKGEPVPVNEYEVRFRLEIDGSEFVVKHGADFDLRGQKFNLKEIDNKASRALIVDKYSSKETWIGRQTESSDFPATGQAGF